MPVQLKWNGRIRGQIQRASQRALLRVATEVFNTSQKYTPLDDGELVLGARVSSENTKGTIEAVVSYGNDAVSKEYAVIQHENLNYRHTPPEQAKFLERAFNEVRPKAEEMLRYLIRNEVEI